MRAVVLSRATMADGLESRGGRRKRKTDAANQMAERAETKHPTRRAQVYIYGWLLPRSAFSHVEMSRIYCYGPTDIVFPPDPISCQGPGPASGQTPAVHCPAPLDARRNVQCGVVSERASNLSGVKERGAASPSAQKMLGVLGDAGEEGKGDRNDERLKTRTRDPEPGPLDPARRATLRLPRYDQHYPTCRQDKLAYLASPPPPLYRPRRQSRYHPDVVPCPLVPGRCDWTGPAQLSPGSVPSPRQQTSQVVASVASVEETTNLARTAEAGVIRLPG